MRWRRTRLTAPAAALVLLVVAVRMCRPEIGSATRPDRPSPPAPGAAAVEAGERRGPYPVVRVVDGDTLHVEVAGSLTPVEKLRLLCVDTPERDEPGWERATAALKALLEGREVELAFERPGRAERDDYGRLLAYVLVGGEIVNVEMVRRGWSRFFTRYGAGRFADAFRAAEREAEAERAGLWSAAGWNARAEEATSPRRRR